MPYPYEAANAYDSNLGATQIEQKNTGGFLALVGATQLKTGPGYLDLVSGVPGSGSVIFYDTALATVASLPSLSTVGVFPSYPTTINGATTNTQTPVTVNIHAAFNNGLFVNTVSTATVAQAAVSYR